MALTTTTTVSAPVNVIFQMNLLRNARANCPYLFGTMPADIQQNGGTFTAKWRRYENITPATTPLAELTGAVAFPTRTGSQPSITDVTATVQKYGDFFFLNEEVDLINYNNQADKLTEVLGIQAGRTVNRLTRDVMEDNATQFFSGTATTATGLTGASTSSGFISSGNIDAIINALDRQDALKFRPLTTGSTNINTTPIRSAYPCFIHPDTSAQIRTFTGFIAVERYAGQTETWPDEIGYVNGVRFIETTESSVDVTTGVAATASSTSYGRSTATRYDMYTAVIIGQDAVGTVGLGFEHIKEVYEAGDTLPGIQIINHARGSAGSADPLSEVSTMGWKTWHAATVLNNNWIRSLRHTVANVQNLG